MPPVRPIEKGGRVESVWIMACDAQGLSQLVEIKRDDSVAGQQGMDHRVVRGEIVVDAEERAGEGEEHQVAPGNEGRGQTAVGDLDRHLARERGFGKRGDGADVVATPRAGTGEAQA